MARKKYMGVWRWWSRWIIVTMITLPDRVRKYNVRKTTKKASLCCQPKLEKPSKRNSTTKVAFDFNIETSVYFRELGAEQKAVMGQTWTRVGWTKAFSEECVYPGQGWRPLSLKARLLENCSHFLSVLPFLWDCRTFQHDHEIESTDGDKKPSRSKLKESCRNILSSVSWVTC